jgi:carotenoid cleavage dioxygenase
MSCVARVDYATGKVSEYYTGETCSTQEAIFVPKSKNAAEGGGYLLSVINHVEEARSDLIILDARHLDAGPLATARMPVRLRYAFHGNWVKKDERH